MNKETLEEALKSYVLTMSLDQSVYIDFLQCAEFGAKWQQEISYSEEEVIQLLQKALTHQDDGETGSLVTAQGKVRTANFYSWFEQNNKK